MDVAYDVVVDVPIERIIEREKIIETLIEKPIEKVVEIPIEQIIEIPVEKILEVPVENTVYREVFVEKLIEKPYDVIRENFIVKERVIDIEEEALSKINLNEVEVLPTVLDYEYRERIVERNLPYENIIENEIRIPKEKIIEIPREVLRH